MKGVLLVNLGSPDSTNPKDVKKYLDEFLMDGKKYATRKNKIVQIINGKSLLKGLEKWNLIQFFPEFTQIQSILGGKEHKRCEKCGKIKQ